MLGPRRTAAQAQSAFAALMKSNPQREKEIFDGLVTMADHFDLQEQNKRKLSSLVYIGQQMTHDEAVTKNTYAVKDDPSPHGIENLLLEAESAHVEAPPLQTTFVEWFSEADPQTVDAVLLAMILHKSAFEKDQDISAEPEANHPRKYEPSLEWMPYDNYHTYLDKVVRALSNHEPDVLTYIENLRFYTRPAVEQSRGR